MKILSTDTFSDSFGIKCLISGQSGAGKTFAITKLQSAGYKPVLISAESGTLSLRGYKIPMIDISRNDDGSIIDMKDRMKRLYEVYFFLKEGKHDFDTIYLDSLTEINHCLMAFLKTKYTDPKETLKMYGENSEMMQRIVKDFRDLKYNVVILSLATVEKDEVGRRFLTADVVGKVAQALPAFFDEVFNLQVVTDDKGNLVRRFQCQPTESIICKDRSGSLSMYEDADLGMIFKKIKNKTTTKQGEK